MNALRLSPVVFASLLLAAHFFRGGQLLMVLVSLALACLLPLRQRWVPAVVTVALILGAVEWLRTLAAIAALRIDLDLPWGRMAGILGVVAVLTALAPLVFRSHALRRWYRRSADSERSSD